MRTASVDEVVSAVAGLSVLLGLVALATVTLLAGVATRAIRVCRRGLASVPRPTVAQLEEIARALACADPTYLPYGAAPDLRLLTDDQLDAAWRDSRSALSCRGDRGHLLRTVEERGRYLDELERRQPDLFRAWLSSDAGAPDNPLPTARAVRSVPAGIDWDELTGGRASDQ